MIRVIYINDAGKVDEFLCDWVDFDDSADEVICYSNGSDSIKIFKPISIVGFDAPIFQQDVIYNELCLEHE